MKKALCVHVFQITYYKKQIGRDLVQNGGDYYYYDDDDQRLPTVSSI